MKKKVAFWNVCEHAKCNRLKRMTSLAHENLEHKQTEQFQIKHRRTSDQSPQRHLQFIKSNFLFLFVFQIMSAVRGLPGLLETDDYQTTKSYLSISKET